jgi:hypothetical protein
VPTCDRLALHIGLGSVHTRVHALRDTSISNSIAANITQSIAYAGMPFIAPFRAMLLSDANKTNYLITLPSSHSCS